MKLIPSISKALALLLIGAGMLSSVGAYAQRTVKGTVSDSNGPLPGVTVLQAGTQNGTVTDVNGAYSINVPEGATLQVSFVGYLTQEVTVGKQAVYDFVLKDDSTMLDEVVITGYGGKTQRSKLTGAISTVKGEGLTHGVYANAADALAGQVAGLYVVPQGNPTSAPKITLRGGTNWDGTGSPLFIIDGQLRDNMDGLNPDDIDRIDVLKDASATAIYGARASNGVILVTTKGGKAGHTEVGFKAQVGFNYLYKEYDYITAEEYITYMRRGLKGYQDNLLTSACAAGTGNDISNPNCLWNLMVYQDKYKDLLNQGWKTMPDPLDPSQTLIYKGINAKDYSFNTPALSQDYTAHISGGNDKGNYYLGVGYNKTEGLPKSVYNQRFSIQFNAGYQINKVLHSQTNFGYNRSNWRSAIGFVNEYNLFTRGLAAPGTSRFEDEKGNPLVGVSQGDGNWGFQVDQLKYGNQLDNFSLNETLTFTILPCLNLKVTGSWLYVNNNQSSFQKDFQTSTGVWNRGHASSEAWQRTFNQTYNAVLNFDKTFAEDHEINAMLGTEYYDSTIKGFSASGSGAPTDDFADLALTDSGAGKRSIDSSNSTYRILSFFTRINYTFKGRYLLSFVAREDGYSSLQNNRWGFFPGVSAGWIFGKENFVKEAMPWLSFGKFKISYGVNGNATGIGPYDLQGAYSNTKYNGKVGFILSTLPNLGLRWERSNTFETGLDLSFFENRLNFNIDYYNRTTTDKYASQILPESTGYSSLRTNNGTFRNQGVEIELNGKIINKKDVSWDLGLIASYNKNTVVSLPDNGLERNRQGATEVYTGNGDETMWVGGYQEGQEPGTIIGFNFLGTYHNASEIPAGRKVYNVFQGTWVDPQVGDAIWEDINGDNKIDAKDQKVLGNTLPHWTGGINTNFRWRGLAVHARFDFGLGFYQYDSAQAMLVMSCNNNLSTTTFVRDTYSVDNPNGKYPTFVYWDPGRHDNYYRTSTIFTQPGNYLNLRSLGLSYTFPKKFTNKFKCQDLTFSATGQNLFWLTKSTTTVPQNQTTGGFNQASTGGYPVPRSFVLGVSLTF